MNQALTILGTTEENKSSNWANMKYILQQYFCDTWYLRGTGNTTEVLDKYAC